ncbi:synaptojanin-2-binding protein [Brachionichthys hirsutus]|uniref:synaptojanin-2-binding protein n=1 Tax=Brachionichthys hirsutus TaxID=412623 RepID=UPI003604E14A
MNGSLKASPNVVDVKLKRGPAGLGFNIVGGVDQHYVVNDNGIYVSKIKEEGVAALDGRLQEGDKILAINGVSLENQTHKHAVELFKNAGEDVQLHVLKKLPDQKEGPRASSSLSHMGIAVTVVGAAALVAFLCVRHLRKYF